MDIISNSNLQIPGILIFNLEKIADERGYFQEKFQKEKLVKCGLPKDFNPVQNNISFNEEKGVTRGLHAEPWEKYITVVSGKIFCAFLDLRPGDSFGKVDTMILDEYQAVFLPKDVANSYQTLTPHVYYSYLVSAHWRPGVTYKSVNVADPVLNISWPIPLSEAIISLKDTMNPNLNDLT
jgi:dTDP-4-dehydrorhamnose 3,5-epimerase